MKTQFLRFLVLTFAFLIFSVSAFAQYGTRMQVEIPFNFNVGNEKLTAGNYEINRISTTSFLFRNKTGSVTVLAQAPLTFETAKNSTIEKLIFNRYGDRYFLRQIFSTRNNVGRALYESKSEKMVRQGIKGDDEMAKKAKPDQVVVDIKTN